MRIGIGSGVLLLVVGAVLYSAFEIDLPYLDDDALGMIFVVGGLAVIIAAVLMNADRPEAGVTTGLLLLGAGAILAVAVRVDVLPYVADYALGTTFICAGLIALLATVAAIVRNRLRGDRHLYDR